VQWELSWFQQAWRRVLMRGISGEDDGEDDEGFEKEAANNESDIVVVRVQSIDDSNGDESQS
jgi:hypothetical protein